MIVYVPTPIMKSNMIYEINPIIRKKVLVINYRKILANFNIYRNEISGLHIGYDDPLYNIPVVLYNLIDMRDNICYCMKETVTRFYKYIDYTDENLKLKMILFLDENFDMNDYIYNKNLFKDGICTTNIRTYITLRDSILEYASAKYSINDIISFINDELKYEIIFKD